MLGHRSPRGTRHRPHIVAIVAAMTLASVVAIQPAEATSGTQQWVSRLIGPSVTVLNHVAGLAVGPDGSRIFVTGDTHKASGGGTLRTVAYDASGTQLWSRGGPGSQDRASAISISPDGSTVFVVGSSYGRHDGKISLDYLTLAYDAATGARVWKKRYTHPIGYSHDEAGALGVSPDGSTVFVTGASDDGSWTDYATVAYQASTGRHLWTARYGRAAKDGARALSVSPDGSAVFVSGFSVSTGTSLDIETIAYNAATGRELWRTRYDGPTHNEDQANAMVVSPDGSKVYVTGFSERSKRLRNFVTLAFSAKTGTRRWVRSYQGPGDSNNNAKAVAISPDGSRIYVAGYRSGPDGRDVETIAYSSTGGRLWRRAYNGPVDGGDQATAIGVSPDGTQVYATGFRNDVPYNRDYATLAYRATSGKSLWEAFYDQDVDGASALGVNPDGSSIYVSGMSGADITTVAYSTV
jgi:WD40 repeat protein